VPSQPGALRGRRRQRLADSASSPSPRALHAAPRAWLRLGRVRPRAPSAARVVVPGLPPRLRCAARPARAAPARRASVRAQGPAQRKAALIGARPAGAGALRDGACALLGAAAPGTVPPPLPRTKWTRRVPHPVLIGHAVCLVQVRSGPQLTSFLLTPPGAGAAAPPPGSCFAARACVAPIAIDPGGNRSGALRARESDERGARAWVAPAAWFATPALADVAGAVLEVWLAPPPPPYCFPYHSPYCTLPGPRRCGSRCLPAGTAPQRARRTSCWSARAARRAPAPRRPTARGVSG
jgi:hypothetical protein